MAGSGTYLTGVAVLSNMELVQDTHDTPDNLFPYLEGTLSAFSRTGRLAYAHFDSDTLARRRNPATNTTLYNIDIPRYGTAPSLRYRMAGSRTHIDASLLRAPVVYFGVGVAARGWSGQWWRRTASTDVQNFIQIFFNYLYDRPTAVQSPMKYVMDPRFAEFFW